MEDIIDIIVTETTNTIEITSQGTDEVIDVNIIDNRDDIVLNVTPTVVEININSLTGNFGVNWGDIGGTLSSQTDLNTALGLKADLVGGKVPSSQLPSYVDDVVEVANYAALPATGETGKIYVVLDTNKIYRWSGSAYIEIADSTAVWGAITGTLSSQTDLQNALNAKFDDPTGDTTQYIAGDGSLVTFPIAGQAGTLVREVRNTTGATLTKGTVVYISGATGNKPTVSKALATGDSTSAQTFGLCQANIANNSNGYVVCVGDIVGLDTSAISEGVQLYLSSTTAGTYTTTKQVAPAHLVYIGVVTRSHPTQGQIEVKIQNGYELDEIHDVAISSVANNQGIFWESSTSLWKNKSIATVLGYTPANGADYLALAGGTMTGAIVGTTATFTNSGSGIGLGVTQSGSSGDGIKITHSAGRAFNLQSSGSGYGVLINNETASTSAPFTIQKQGLDKITFTDAGAGSFASSLTASSFVKSGGTSSQFLKADGSVDSSTYLTTGTASSTYLPLTGGTLTGALNGTSVSLSSSVTASALYVTGMTAGSGAIYHTGSRLTFANYNASGTLHFEVNGGTAALTLNSDLSASFNGSVGVGTSPSGTYGKLTVAGGIKISNDNNGKLEIGRYSSGTPNSYIKLGASSNSLRFTNNDDTADLLYLTNGGNLGLGNTPNSWATGWLALQVGTSALQNVGSFSQLSNNIYYDGTNYKFITSNGGSRIGLNTDGEVFIGTVGSGTAGGTATMVTRLSINGSTGAATFFSSVTANGVKFNGGSSTLNYYEEGTFTPGLTFGGGSTGMTFFDRAGVYTRIGRQVTCTIYLALTAKGSSTGDASLTGLPFTNGNYNRGSSSAASIRFDNITYSGDLQMILPASTNYISFEQVTTAGADSRLTHSNFNDSTEMTITVTYFA